MLTEDLENYRAEAIREIQSVIDQAERVLCAADKVRVGLRAYAVHLIEDGLQGLDRDYDSTGEFLRQLKLSRGSGGGNGTLSHLETARAIAFDRARARQAGGQPNQRAA